MVRQGALMFVLSGCVNEGHGEKTTIVRARRPIDAAVVALVWWHQACSGLAFRCELSCVKVGFVMACINHTRAGTVPDRRGRCGMNQGLSRSVLVGRGLLGSVTALCVMEPLPCQARAPINAEGAG